MIPTVSPLGGRKISNITGDDCKRKYGDTSQKLQVFAVFKTFFFQRTGVLNSDSSGMMVKITHVRRPYRYQAFRINQ